jgi:hypothetical protein
VPKGRSATLAITQGADKVRLWTAQTGGTAIPAAGTTIAGGAVQTYWIEAFAPSASMADIAFTLTPAGGSPASPDRIRATAAAVDLSIDDLPADIEDGSGAYVWRNSDFTRRINAPDSRQTEAGVTRYLPDYTLLTTIDPAFADQFTKARATFTAGMAPAYRFRFDVGDPASVALWTTTQWDGFVAAGDGWWRIPTDADVQPKAITDTTLTFWIEGLRTTGYAAGRLEFKPVPMVLAPSGQPSRLPSSDAVRFTVLDAGLGVDGNRDGTIDFADSYDRQLTFWLNGDRETLEYVDPDAWFNSTKFETDNASGDGEADSADGVLHLTRDLEDFASLRLLIDPMLEDIQVPSGPFFRSTDQRDTPRPDKPLVRYDLHMGKASAARLHVFRSAGERPDSHVRDKDAAELQVSDVSHNAFNLTQKDPTSGSSVIGRVAMTLNADFLLNSKSLRPDFLFEAFGQPAKTTLTFTVTVTYPQPQGSGGAPRTTARSHDLSLDLRSIEDFYTRMRVPYRQGDKDDRFTHFTPGTTDLPHFAAAQPLFTGKTGDMSFLSGNDSVVLVHGWNMTDGTQTSGPKTDWKKAFAETAFKRLYWQGFRGEFTAFDWPTFADTEGPLKDRDPWIVDRWYPGAMVENAYRNLTYNASEYQAWRSGQALMTYLAEIRSPAGATHLLAHSMGNVVAAEALRQWSASGHDTAVPLVNTYVAMQGALSAGAYGSDDTRAGIGNSTSDLYRHWPSGDGPNMDDYYMRGADSAARKWVNMFNPVDAATAGEKKSVVVPIIMLQPDNRTAWPLNNRLRPPSSYDWLAQSTVWPEHYAWFPGRGFVQGFWGRDGNAADPSSFFRTEADLNLGLVLPEPVNGRLQPGPSAYETMAFLARSEAMPIGTMEVDFFGRENNVDITTLGLSTTYEAQWPGHSFQFNFDAATTDTFWARIRSETNFRSTRP